MTDKYTNLKTEIGRVNEKTQPRYMLRAINFKYNTISRLKIKGWKIYTMQTLVRKEIKTSYINIV